jgi:hypothetical protein
MGRITKELLNSWQEQETFLFFRTSRLILFLVVGEGGGLSSWRVKLNIYLLLMPRLRMSGTVPPLLHMPL